MGFQARPFQYETVFRFVACFQTSRMVKSSDRPLKTSVAPSPTAGLYLAGGERRAGTGERGLGRSNSNVARGHKQLFCLQDPRKLARSLCLGRTTS